MSSGQALEIPPAVVASVSEDLPVTFGAWLICACIGCMLFGLTAHQTYRYFRLYPKDDPSLKLLVVALLVLDTMHTVTNVHLCYYYLVINYLSPFALASGVWSLRISIAETALVMLLSHSFFLRRIFLLGERRLFPVFIIGFLMVSELAFATAVTVMTFVLVTFEGFASHMWMIWVMLANAVVIDILLTGCLIFFLWRSKTGFRRTDNLLDVLMVYSINTGLSTSLLTLPAMICSIVMPTNLLWSAIYVVASKMYANSLLAVLNSRRSLIDKGLEGFETGSFGLQVVDDREPRPFDLKAAPLPSPPMSLAGGRGAGTHTYTHTHTRSNSNSNTLTNTLSNTLTNGSSSPSSVTVTHARPGAASLNQLKVADRVIGIQVTTETFVDIQPPRHIPCPYPSTSGGGVRTARPRPLPPIARRNGGGSGSGASLLGLGAPSDDPCDGSESV